MPKYLFTGSYTTAGAKGVFAEGGSARKGVVETLISSLGGTLESFHFALGANDFYAIADLPDNVAAAAGSMAASATGAVACRTTVLLTPEEADAVARLSPTYRAPGA